jgi:GT2 family glycosyltransferase
MIKYEQPYITSKNIGEYYNESMSRLPSSNDWICFTDGDSMFTTNEYGHHIERIVKKHGEKYSLLTCMTNRIGRKEQTVPNTWESDDMAFHREVGRLLQEGFGDNVVDVTNGEPIGGVMILLSKDSWEKTGGFKTDGILGVDNDMHYKIRDNGMRVGIMSGVYRMHYYRGGVMTNKAHLLKK